MDLTNINKERLFFTKNFTFIKKLDLIKKLRVF
jgi:hypothetical protein